MVLFFLDIGLPDRSGIDVARQLRQESEEVKIAAITGWDEDKVDKELFNLTITKPFNINQLQEFLESNSPKNKEKHDASDGKTILWENITKEVI